MQLLIILTVTAVVSAVSASPSSTYDSKYDNFNVDEVTDNDRLLRAYSHCFIGDGKCTPEGTDIKSWIPEAVQTSCGKCTDKQKVLVAKTIRAIQSKLPEEWDTLYKLNDPDGKYADQLKEFLESH